MTERQIKVLHFVVDDKFIDGEMNAFDIDNRFTNTYVFVSKSPDYKFSWIKKTEKVALLYGNKRIKEYLSKEDYDVVFFVSLPDFHILNYVPRDKIVIWWAFGFDIYGPNRFIDIPLYMPLTAHYVIGNMSLINRAKSFLKRFSLVLRFFQGDKNAALNRINYFQPPIPYEYKLMRLCAGFMAKEFYYPKSHSFPYLNCDLPCHNSNIVIGNSATETNNHIDVWTRIKPYVPESSSVVLPINYGNHKYADYLEKVIFKDKNNIVFIKEFLPKDEYFSMLGSCGFAVYGVLREQAMGGINRCLANGVKLFLYKNSVPYKYLKELGCVIFAIEEIDENSFREPLSMAQIHNNRVCLKKEENYVNSVTEEAIKDIQSLINHSQYN